jgi:hypothetical protein
MIYGAVVPGGFDLKLRADMRTENIAMICSAVAAGGCQSMLQADIENIVMIYCALAGRWGLISCCKRT